MPRTRKHKTTPPAPKPLANVDRVPTAKEVIEKWQGLFDGLAHRNDAVCIIVGTAYIEHSLGALLRAHFIDSNLSHDGMLQPIKGPLGELSKRAKTAYLLGLISDGCRNTVEGIAKIRNQIAHSTDILSFKDESIAKLCRELKFPKTGPATVVFPPLKPIPKNKLGEPRKRFVFLAVMLCTHIILKANNVAKCSKLEDYWDDV